MLRCGAGSTGENSRGWEMTWVIAGAVVVVLVFVLLFRLAWK
jgi:hypothetical protein